MLLLDSLCSTHAKFRAACTTALVIGVLATLCPMAGNASSFTYAGDVGDYVSGGRSETFTTPGTRFDASIYPDTHFLRVTMIAPNNRIWSFHFAPPQGARLVPGVYTGASRHLVPGPMLDVSGDARGCNWTSGQFEVLDSVYGPFDYVERFHATFVQYCGEQATGPALYGEIDITNPVAIAPQAVVVTVNAEGAVSRPTRTASVGGTIACARDTPFTITGMLEQRHSRNYLSLGHFNVDVQCTGTPQPWSADTVAFQYGYQQGPATVYILGQIEDTFYHRTVHVNETLPTLLKSVGRKK